MACSTGNQASGVTTGVACFAGSWVAGIEVTSLVAAGADDKDCAFAGRRGEAADTGDTDLRAGRGGGDGDLRLLLLVLALVLLVLVLVLVLLKMLPFLALGTGPRNLDVSADAATLRRAPSRVALIGAEIGGSYLLE
jgi:hypothetical protein